jgi:uncharacterized surface protein with fasciclin (FAS1) repeats
MSWSSVCPLLPTCLKPYPLTTPIHRLYTLSTPVLRGFSQSNRILQIDLFTEYTMRFSALTLAAVLAFGSVAAPAAAQTPVTAQNDIVQVAAEAGIFSTLLAAATAAGLVETLKSEGPFTVFAPTDEAFAKLPEGTVASLLENPEALRGILLYHVVPGRVTAAQVVNLTSATTAQGADIRIAVENGTVRINNATVTTADVAASNGVIHIIDTVILPPSAN